MNEEVYVNKIQPLLKDIANPVIIIRAGGFVTYAVAIRGPTPTAPEAPETLA